jgi:serine/threonine-protein kinase RsbW
VVEDTAVEVRTAAAAKHLSSVRAVAADLAMREDFDLDSVADLRLAVDEACSTLVQLAIAESELRCTFTVRAGELRVLASVRSATGTGPATNTFSWQVLHTLAEEARSEVIADGEAFLVRIELVKRRPDKQ